MVSMVSCLISEEKASPLILLQYLPAAVACFSNAAVWYQPAEPGLCPLGGFSKKIPSVSAPQEKVELILDASPKPCEAPITRTF